MEERVTVEVCNYHQVVGSNPTSEREDFLSDYE